MTRSHWSSFCALLVGLAVPAVLPACGDKTSLTPAKGSGGSSVIEAPGTGGIGTGGASEGVGGAILGTGGAGFGTGGAGFGTGGASFGTGGASFGTGGAILGTGGASLGTGGSSLASGGTGGGGAVGCAYPSCLWNLIKDCLVTGPCTREDVGTTGVQQRLCCSNGVTQIVSIQTTASSGLSGTMSITKDGARCYTVDVTGRVLPSGDVRATYTWLDPSGRVALTGELSNSDFVALTCPGEAPVEFDINCSADGSDGADITDGTCN